MGGVRNSDTSLGSRREVFCEDKSQVQSVGVASTHTPRYMERRKKKRKTNKLRNTGDKRKQMVTIKL